VLRPANEGGSRHEAGPAARGEERREKDGQETLTVGRAGAA